MKALVNADIYDFHSYRPGSYILFDTVIRETGPMKDLPAGHDTYDCKNALVMPGSVVSHTHIYSALARGMSLPYTPSDFRQILEQLWWRFDAGIDLDATYHSARVMGLEHLQCGVTTLIDHHASGTAIRGTLDMLKQGICDETGLRGIFCFETSDRFDTDACIAENIEFARAQTGGSCAGMMGLHASLSLGDATLEKISRAGGDIPIHVHAAESAQDEQECLEKYGKRVVRRFDDHGLLRPGSILAHCTHIDEDEAETIAKRQCVIAVNTASNMNNAVGLPDMEMFNKHGIPTVIGTDGLGANMGTAYLSTLFSMHLKTGSAWRYSIADLKTCITQSFEHAGRLLGIRLGRIEAGYCADMAAHDYRPPTPMTQDNALGHAVYGLFDRCRPRDVWCGGALKLQNYRSTFDEEAIYAGAREAARKLWAKTGAGKP